MLKTPANAFGWPPHSPGFDQITSRTKRELFVAYILSYLHVWGSGKENVVTAVKAAVKIIIIIPRKVEQK
jgi:hypothetical protein